VAELHGGHDLEAMVAFADQELAGPDLEAAAAQVLGCRECAGLVADLRSLALADRRLATPGRPRDFRLSTADAERLQAVGPEPEPVATRLGGDMTGIPATHATHDPELIAAAIGRELAAPERRLFDSWLATCSACAELHADLLAIAAVQRTLPVPSRPRDFQLTPAQARRLQPGGYRAILAAIGSSRDAFSKPLAVGLTTLGLVGLLVGTVPSFGSATGAAPILSTVGAYTTDDGTVFGGQDANPSAAPSMAAAAPIEPDGSAAASADSASQPELSSAAPELVSEGPRDVAGAAVSPAPSLESAALRATEANGKADGLGFSSTDPSPLLIVSLALLVVGVGLFLARWAARRLRAA
jgi:anti-sigma factor RsiW